MTSKEMLLKKIEELKKEVENLDNEYPKYMIFNASSKCEQFIVELTEDTVGKVVAVADNSIHKIGYRDREWTIKSQPNLWNATTNPNELCDMDLVECGNDKCSKMYRFYDAKNKCTFKGAGNRDGAEFDCYRKVMPWETPDWAIKAQKLLKGENCE